MPEGDLPDKDLPDNGLAKGVHPQPEPLQQSEAALLPGSYEFTLGGYASMPLGTAGYASFARRFAAMFLDGILMILAIFPSAFIIGLVIGVAGVLVQMPYQGRLLVAKLSGFVFAVLVRWFYFAACECSVWQATPGKKALGIRVTDLQGNRISFGRATKRFFSKYISSLALGFGFWCVLWDQRSQGWHDRIADTLVLNR